MIELLLPDMYYIKKRILPAQFLFIRSKRRKCLVKKTLLRIDQMHLPRRHLLLPQHSKNIRQPSIRPVRHKDDINHFVHNLFIIAKQSRSRNLAARSKKGEPAGSPRKI